MSCIVKATMIGLAATALHDASRIGLMALGLHKIRASAPELFNGEIAADGLDEYIREIAKEFADAP